LKAFKFKVFVVLVKFKPGMT